eukprot:9788240-Alexandrium_andersonii.AAC.1
MDGQRARTLPASTCASSWEAPPGMPSPRGQGSPGLGRWAVWALTETRARMHASTWFNMRQG